jgi:hypothetical protein
MHARHMCELSIPQRSVAHIELHMCEPKELTGSRCFGWGGLREAKIETPWSRLPSHGRLVPGRTYLYSIFGDKE